MEFNNFSFIVSDECNFCCSYCFQTHEKRTMKSTTIQKSVEFFYPFLEQESRVFFFGGEPLLAFDNISLAVSLFEEKNKKNNKAKKLTYSLITNGSLVTK